MHNNVYLWCCIIDSCRYTIASPHANVFDFVNSLPDEIKHKVYSIQNIGEGLNNVSGRIVYDKGTLKVV